MYYEDARVSNAVRRAGRTGENENWTSPLYPPHFVIISLFVLFLAGCGDTKTPTTTTAPSAPTGVSATAGNGQVTISWTAVSGATSYNIYWSTTTGVTKSNGTKISSATSPYTHTGLTNGTTYYYIATAVNSSGESVESAQVSAKPAATAATATINDFVGTWTGNLTKVGGGGAGTNADTIKLSINGSLLNGVSVSKGDTMSGTVSNGVYNFTMQTVSTHPDCVANWNVSGTATLDNTLSSMTWTATGKFCESVSSTVSGTLTKAAGTGTHTASGTYTWNSTTGVQTWNWTSSNFVCDGPSSGSTNTKTGVIITSTTMTYDGGDIWTRSSGTAGDIVGTWTFTNSTTGNSFTMTYNADLTVSLVGNIVSCGSTTLFATTFKVDDVLAACPTYAEIGQIDLDLTLDFSGDPTRGTLVCRASEGSADLTLLQKRTYNALLMMRDHLSFDAPLPWTNQPLYVWLLGAVRGIHFRDDIVFSFCCDPTGIINIQTGIAVAQTNALFDIWPFIKGFVALIIHEARHNEGYLHTCGTNDNTISELGAWGVQYYFNIWLVDHLDNPSFFTPRDVDPILPQVCGSDTGPACYRDEAIRAAEDVLGQICQGAGS